jgi:AcrR family transcriptional regulator
MTAFAEFGRRDDLAERVRRCDRYPQSSLTCKCGRDRKAVGRGRVRGDSKSLGLLRRCSVRHVHVVGRRAGVGNRHHARRVAGDADELRQRPSCAVEHGIHSGWCQRADPFNEPSSVRRRLRAEGAQQGMIMLARRSDDGSATGDRKLNGNGADRARRSLHEHRIPGANGETVEDPGGRLDAARGGACFLPTPGGRSGCPLCQDCEVGIGAAHGRVGIAEHLVADAHTSHAVADFVNDTRGVETGPERKCRGCLLASRAGADEHLPGAERRSPHCDTDFAASGMWWLDLDDLQDAGRAVLGELDCSHAPTVTEHPVRIAKVRVMTTQVRAKLRSDARDNRGRILAVARAAFATEGLDVPLREIARRAEVGVATVYRHFQTKDALLTEAFADQMTMCSAVVEEGLAADDPWRGFCLVIEKLMEIHALDRGFARAFTSQIPQVDLAAERDRALRLLLKLVRRAKAAGPLRADFVLEDISLALMANEGIRAESPKLRVAASRRFAALMIQSFQANPVPTPLPPAVRLAPLPTLRTST